MRGTRTRVGLVAAALLGGLLVTTQPASAGPGTTLSLRPVDTRCTDKHDRLRWRGGQESYAHSGGLLFRPRGTMYACWALYKVKENRKRYDWWVGYLETRWYNAKVEDGSWDTEAYASQFVGSSQWAVDNTESATPGFTSSRSCGSPFTVSAGLYGASVSTTQQVCKEFRVRRGAFDANSGYWDMKYVGKADRIETVFMQKVKAGSGRPTFTYVVEIPRYTYEHDGAILVRDENYRYLVRKI